MTTGKKVIIGVGTSLAAVLLYKLARKGEAAKALSVKILSIDLRNYKLYLNLQIFNPSRQTIKIDSIAADVYYNSKNIGVIQYINSTPILPLSYSNFKNVLIELSPAGLYTLTTSILLRTDKSKEFIIDGKIFVKGVGLPFVQKFKLS